MRTVLLDGPMSDSDQATIVLLPQKYVASSRLLHQMVLYSQLWKRVHVRQVRTLVSLVRQQVTMQDLVDEVQLGHVMEVTDEPMRVVVSRMPHVLRHTPLVLVHTERMEVHVHVVYQLVPEQSGVLAHIQRILTFVERLDM